MRQNIALVINDYISCRTSNNFLTQMFDVVG
jgi:hypothetical protein